MSTTRKAVICEFLAPVLAVMKQAKVQECSVLLGAADLALVHAALLEYVGQRGNEWGGKLPTWQQPPEGTNP